MRKDIAVIVRAVMLALIACSVVVALSACMSVRTAGSSSRTASSASAQGQSSSAASTQSQASVTALSAQSVSSSSAAQADRSLDGWYTVQLYLFSRNGKPVPSSMRDRFAEIHFNQDTMTVDGALSHAGSKDEAMKVSYGNSETETGVFDFKMSNECSYMVGVDHSMYEKTVDYNGFKDNLYLGAGDLQDSMVSFHVVNGEVVEAVQWLLGTG